MQGSTLHDDEAVADVVSAGLDGASGDVLVVNPTTDTIRELVAELPKRANPPTVRLLADEDVRRCLASEIQRCVVGIGIDETTIERFHALLAKYGVRKPPARHDMEEQDLRQRFRSDFVERRDAKVIQQLREGVPNFFATFIEVLKDGAWAVLSPRYYYCKYHTVRLN